jgi:hypothetical protein
MRKAFLTCLCCFMVFVVLALAQDEGKIITKYSYGSGASPIAVEAKAYLATGGEEKLVGEAKFVDFHKNEGVRVEETHYSTEGTVIYQARSEFDLITGEKIYEVPIKGKKTLDLFFRWPGLMDNLGGRGGFGRF